VVGVLAPNGQGESAVRSWIAANAKRRNGMQCVFRARQFVSPVTREELDGIVDLWVDGAMRLGDRELKMMSRLARAQARRMEQGSSGFDAVQAELAPAAEPLAMAG
jgi:DSF synthase